MDLSQAYSQVTNDKSCWEGYVQNCIFLPLAITGILLLAKNSTETDILI